MPHIPPSFLPHHSSSFLLISPHFSPFLRTWDGNPVKTDEDSLTLVIIHLEAHDCPLQRDGDSHSIC